MTSWQQTWQIWSILFDVITLQIMSSSQMKQPPHHGGDHGLLFAADPSPHFWLGIWWRKECSTYIHTVQNQTTHYRNISHLLYFFFRRGIQNSFFLTWGEREREIRTTVTTVSISQNIFHHLRVLGTNVMVPTDAMIHHYLVPYHHDSNDDDDHDKTAMDDATTMAPVDKIRSW